ncbi:hypothetical protein ACFL52_04945 [Candidatus Margulisiibacteriota bacterium]
MKKTTILLVLLAVFLFNTCAQAGDLYNLAKYQAESKNSAIAILGAWIFPSAGHAYAGDWNRGLPFLALNVGLPYFMSVSGGSAVLTAGYTVSRIWEYVDAASTAQQTNNKLVDQLCKTKYGIPTVAVNTISEDSSLVVEESNDLEILSDKIDSMENKYDKNFKMLFEKINKESVK